MIDLSLYEDISIEYGSEESLRSIYQRFEDVIADKKQKGYTHLLEFSHSMSEDERSMHYSYMAILGKPLLKETNEIF